MRQNTILNTFIGFDFSNYSMPLITVYRNPSDFKGKFVARLFDLEKPTEYVIVKDTLEEVRAVIPPHFSRFARFEEDDPVIVEVWW
jgi:hypothetical protein